MTIVAFLILPISMSAHAEPLFPWSSHRMTGASLAERIDPPSGFKRTAAVDGSFASWLRSLPLRREGTVVRLFDGRQKHDQGGVYAVLDIDIGSRDLQQCADAVIRLRAEYLLAAGCEERIAFDFTSGHPARWKDWSSGRRPVVSGDKVSWTLQAASDSSYTSFREYLNAVFIYAGSFSLARQLETVADPSTVRPGDVFIRGGFPGHAVVVVDVAEADDGRKVFLIAQSYMPAQDVHVLRNPASRDSPWYPALREGSLPTPEWAFSYSDLRRFREPDCDAHQGERLGRGRSTGRADAPDHAP